MRSVFLILMLLADSAFADLQLTGSAQLAGSAQLSGNGQYVAPPVAAFTVNTNGGVATLAITFTDNSTATPTSWSWSFGDGATSTSQSPSHSYTASGLYTVTLTAANAGGNSSATTNISVWIVGHQYSDFENGNNSDPITTTILTNGTHGSLGSWSLPANNQMQVVTSESTLLTPTVVGATSYSDAGSTRSFRARMDTLTNYARVDLAANLDVLSYGTFITIDTIGSSFQTLDYVEVDTTTGDAFIFQSSSTFNGRAHDAGSGNVGADIALTASTKYWLTGVFHRNGSCTNNLYNGTTGALVGTSIVSMNTDTPAQYIRIGRADGHAGANPANTSWVTYDDFIINTNGVFPLGP